ncbi:ATP-binding protein [Streptomyces litchfieldiae]|uniref:ATP-binding protein n=1 Tax=Streptomyces litchfieldiae TaxID=3075543 RepID=A0ABU2MTD0_9ACTN|nr:ATP-binding protein [Streptomyces sp. DSM 44938]MDT0344123.1 ATP-binding protein [Streptomyces sp. DSM 44938]
MSQPPSLRSRLTLADTPNSVNWARRHTVDVLTNWCVSPDVIETVRLVVSELITNAVRHPEQGDEPSHRCDSGTAHIIELALEIVGAAVRVSVWDRDPKPPLLKEVGPAAIGGRGLFIVAAMSERWGHYPPHSRLGKVVWAEIRLPTTDTNGTAHRRTRAPEQFDGGGCRPCGGGPCPHLAESALVSDGQRHLASQKPQPSFPSNQWRSVVARGPFLGALSLSPDDGSASHRRTGQ